MTVDIPGRVFLDTSVVNFMLDHGAEIHDGVPLDTADARDVADIEALRNLYVLGQRAMWQLAVSPFSYSEIARTKNEGRRRQLDGWFQELWQYWRSIIDQNDDLPSFMEAEGIRVRLLTSGLLTEFPDVSDRVLVCDAIVYRCELFCTRDWKTILERRAQFVGLPIQIVSPTEWWEKIRPHAGLWP